MSEEPEVVTAPAATTYDSIEIQSTHDEQPTSGSEAKVDEQTESTSEKAEVTPKPLNPRTAQRKAEKERLIREAATKDAENKQLLAEIARLKQSEPKVEAKREVDLSKEPDIKDYDDAITYARDLAKYDAAQIIAERDKKESEAQRTKQIEAYQEQADIIRTEMPDFDDKVDALYTAGLIQAGSVLENEIIASPDSAKLAAHFVNFPGDLKSLNMYKPEAIPAALKQIQSWIKSQGTTPQPTVRQSQAKPPINPVGQKAAITKAVNSLTKEELEEMPQHEFEAKYMRK